MIPSAGSRGAEAPASGQTLAEGERAHILQVLRDTHGVIGGPQGAAARLGGTPHQLALPHGEALDPTPAVLTAC